MAQNFRKTHSLEERRKCSTKMRAMYPERVPVLLERADRNIPELKKYKFLVPMETTMGRFVFDVRQYVSIGPTQALYLFINDTIVPNQKNFAEIYHQYHDEDGFVYIKYSGENTFG
jgi:GABA(A) receptor-associated protein